MKESSQLLREIGEGRALGERKEKESRKERNCASPVLCTERGFRKSALIFRVSMLLLEV